jgi:protein TonB
MTFFIPEESIKEISDKVRVIYLENFITEIPADKKDIQLPKNVLPKTGTVKFLTPEIKADELVSSDVVPTQEDLVGNNPGIETVEGNINGNDIIAEFIGTGNSNAETTTKDQVYTWVEEMPAFPGGNSELLKFFTQNLIYPEIAKRAGVEGKVVLSFVVDKSGDISEVKVLKSIGAGCDEEAMRVLKIMPRWTAGKQNGNPVITRINIPVVFKLR